MASSPEEFAKKLGKVAAVAAVASEKWVRSASKLVQVEELAGAAAVTHGTLRLRGVGKSGARLGVVSKVVGSGRSTTGIVSARGPWILIEKDTKPHVVGAKEGPDGPAHLAVPGADTGWRTGPFIAGGSHGKHPFVLAAERARPKVGRLYATTVGKEITSVF